MGPYVGGRRLPDVMKLTTGHQGKARIKTSAPVLDESLSFLEGYLGIDFFFYAVLETCCKAGCQYGELGQDSKLPALSLDSGQSPNPLSQAH